jgi:hypothetical protein
MLVAFGKEEGAEEGTCVLSVHMFSFEPEVVSGVSFRLNVLQLQQNPARSRMGGQVPVF